MQKLVISEQKERQEEGTNPLLRGF